MLVGKPLLVIVLNSFILASGILIVLIACFQYANYYPLLSVFIHILSVLQLMMCGACGDSTSDSSLIDGDYDSFGGSDDVDLKTAGIHIAWLLFGVSVVGGYAIPSLLYRASDVPEAALYLTWGGGTTILVAMIVYMRLIYRDGPNSGAL